MEIHATAQTTLIDLTDGYSVVLSADSHVFEGTHAGVKGTQSVEIKVNALCGNEPVDCTIGAITYPVGMSGEVDGQTIKISATPDVKTGGSITIPVQIDEITIGKAFTWAIAFAPPEPITIYIESSKGTLFRNVPVATDLTAHVFEGKEEITPDIVWLKDGEKIGGGATLTVKAGDVSDKAVYTAQTADGAHSAQITLVELIEVQTVKSMTAQYAQVGQDEDPTEWTTTKPDWVDGKRIFVRTLITYQNPTATDTTDPVELLTPEDLNAYEDSADKKIEQYRSDMEKTNQEIYSSVNSIYSTTAGLSTSLSELQSKVTQDADSLTMQFNTLNEAVANVDGRATKTQTQLDEMFTFTANGLVIGSGDHTLEISESQIAFMQGDNAVASISDGVLKITEADISTTLDLGNFAFIPRDNGSLDFKKVK